MARLCVRTIIITVATLTAVSSMALGLCGCSSGATTGGPELSVWAAAGLKSAFTELAQVFDQKNGSVTNLVFDSAGALQKQIAVGAPADVFASSDPEFMAKLAEEGFVETSVVRPFASNEVVLIVPAGCTLEIDGFEDLADPLVERVSVGNPETTPLGRMAVEEILPALGILEALKDKLIYSQTVSQTFDYVNREEVDAGIVWVSEAVAGGAGIKMVATADPDWHSVVKFEVSVVRRSENASLAQGFVDFVLSPDGQSVLQKHGFLSIATGS